MVGGYERSHITREKNLLVFFMRCAQARKTEFKKCQCETTMQMKMLEIFWSISQWPLIDYTFNANITIFRTFQMISILKPKLSKQATLCP